MAVNNRGRKPINHRNLFQHVLDYEQRFVLVKALEAIEHVMVKVNEVCVVSYFIS